MILDGARVFTGETVIEAGWVQVAGSQIVSVGDQALGLPGGGEPRVDLGGAILAPGFVDLMVNGGGGVLFNAEPDRIAEIAASHRQRGTTSILGNFITDSVPNMGRARAAVDRAGETSGVLGIHFEGPVLGHERRGMHSPAHLASGDAFPVELARRTDSTITVVTLAPEIAGPELIRALMAQGARVAFGHTSATIDEFRAGVAAGGSLVTHIFNGMEPLSGRAPGVIGGALTDDSVAVTLINDGKHLDYASVRLAWRAKPTGKCFFVSDAMSQAGSGPREFDVAGVHVREAGGSLVTADGSLAGSLLDMAGAVRNGVNQVGIPLEEALRMASTYPARYLGAPLGVIAPGTPANMVVLDHELMVRRVMFQGDWVPAA